MIEKQEKLLFLVSEKRVLVRDRNMCVGTSGVA